MSAVAFEPVAGSASEAKKSARVKTTQVTAAIDEFLSALRKTRDGSNSWDESQRAAVTEMEATLMFAAETLRSHCGGTSHTFPR